MELFIELAPISLTSRARTHKINLPDVASFKRYVRGQVTGCKSTGLGPTISQEKRNPARPAYAIVKTTSALSSEANILFIISAAYHNGRLQPFEKTYNSDFIEGQEKKVLTL